MDGDASKFLNVIRRGFNMLFLGRYQAIKMLGQGSMGRVFLAHSTQDPQARVVVKVMHPHLAQEPRFRQLFAREMQSMQRLRHPYIVRLIDASLDDPNGACLVMEFIDGITLDDVLQRTTRLPPGHVGLLLGYLCHALQAAAGLGIVHRDLKPGNLMVAHFGQEDESLHVMDFGLALRTVTPHFSVDRLSGSREVNAQGTPAYICPEQLRGDEVDGRADLYSVGVMLFEMLTGHVPFPHADTQRLLWAHMKEKPLSFAQVGSYDIDPGIEAVVQRCLAKYPVERPATPRELADAYSQAIGIDIWEATLPVGYDPLQSHPECTSRPLSTVGSGDLDTIIHELEAWMPEKIAVVKLRGFLEDAGASVLLSEPGLLRVQIGGTTAPEKRSWFPSFRAKPTQPPLDPIEIELHMEKPNPVHNRLHIRILFRPLQGREIRHRLEWQQRCGAIYNEMKSYFIAQG